MATLTDVARAIDRLDYRPRERAEAWAALPEAKITPDAWPVVAALAEAAAWDARPPHPLAARHLLADHLALALPAARALGWLYRSTPGGQAREALGRVSEAVGSQWLWWWSERDGEDGDAVLRVLAALWGCDHA